RRHLRQDRPQLRASQVARRQTGVAERRKWQRAARRAGCGGHEAADRRYDDGADRLQRPGAAARLLHGGAQGHRRRSAEQPRQERYGGIAVAVGCPTLLYYWCPPKRSEIPLEHFERVAGSEKRAGTGLDADHLAALVEALDVEGVLAGAVGEAAGHGHGIERGHVGHVRIVTGLLHLTDDEERPARQHFGADARIDQVVRLKLRSDRLLQLVGRHARGRYVADQREGQNAVAVERVLAGQRWLAEYGDTQSVVRAKFVVEVTRRG